MATICPWRTVGDGVVLTATLLKIKGPAKVKGYCIINGYVQDSIRWHPEWCLEGCREEMNCRGLDTNGDFSLYDIICSIRWLSHYTYLINRINNTYDVNIAVIFMLQSSRDYVTPQLQHIVSFSLI